MLPNKSITQVRYGNLTDGPCVSWSDGTPDAIDAYEILSCDMRARRGASVEYGEGYGRSYVRSCTESSSIIKMISASRPTVAPSATSRRSTVRVMAASWAKASTTDALKAAGGKLVVELSGQKVSGWLGGDR